MGFKYDKDSLKENLSIEEVFDLVAELGGEPKMNIDSFTARTIWHGGSSHKLYYYANTHLFHCYTECGDASFDIYELVLKINKKPEVKPTRSLTSYKIKVINPIELTAETKKIIAYNIKNNTKKLKNNMKEKQLAKVSKKPNTNKKVVVEIDSNGTSELIGVRKLNFIDNQINKVTLK